jgi:hypothetical protein
MDWSELYPQFFTENGSNDKEKKMIEFADIGCGYGGLLGKIRKKMNIIILVASVLGRNKHKMTLLIILVAITVKELIFVNLNFNVYYSWILTFVNFNLEFPKYEKNIKILRKCCFWEWLENHVCFKICHRNQLSFI